MANPATQSGARAFGFLDINVRPPKPRTRGLTEVRGPYYKPIGARGRRSQPGAAAGLFAAGIWGPKSLWGRVVTYKG